MTTDRDHSRHQAPTTTRTPPPRFEELGFTNEPRRWPWPLYAGDPHTADPTQPIVTFDGQPLGASPWQMAGAAPIVPVDEAANVQPVDSTSQPARTLTVLLDMDGPLADFDAEFHRRCVAEGWQFDAGVCGPEDQRHRYFTDHMPKRKQRRKAREMVDGPGWFAGLPVTPGAQEGVEELLSRGHQVWVVTKPLATSATCLSEKQAWIGEWFPELADRLITASDKSMVRGDLLLDDAIRTQWIPDAEWQPVVFSTPFNGSDTEWAGLPRWTWADGIEALERLVPEPSIDQLLDSIGRRRQQRAVVEPLLDAQAARLGVR